MTATIGVLGEMGPMATVETFRRITMATSAEKDRDHLHVIVDSDPSISDRTAALLNSGEDPRPYLLRSVERLVAVGAEVTCVPCNTANVYYHWPQARVPVPIVNMIAETVRVALSAGARSFGLLATARTCRVNLYGAAFSDVGPQLVPPDVVDQASVRDDIARIKAGTLDNVEHIYRIADRLTGRGGTTLALGCTEISLVASRLANRYSVIDALDVLVAATVACARVSASLVGMDDAGEVGDVA